MRAISCAALLVLTALAAPAGAKPIAYAELPSGTVPGMPAEKDVPKEIKASEAVAGMLLAAPPPEKPAYRSGGLRYLGLFVSKDDAEAYEKGSLKRWGPRKAPEGSATACFRVAEQWDIKQGFWRSGRDHAPTVHAARRGSEEAKGYEHYASVRAVRLEKLILGDPSAPEGSAEREPSLRILDAWMDPTTLGMREIAQATLPLRPVAQAPGGLQIFAARTADEVHFVVYRPPIEESAKNFLSDNFSLRSSEEHDSMRCGHAHVVLTITPAGGEQATLTTEVVLPSKQKKDEKVEEIRTRELAIHLGVSQSTEDPAPVPTLSLGWAGRSQRHQIF